MRNCDGERWLLIAEMRCQKFLSGVPAKELETESFRFDVLRTGKDINISAKKKWENRWKGRRWWRFAMTSFAFCKLHIKISLYFILFESPRGMVLQRRGPGVTESSKRKKKCCKNVTWSQIRYYKSYSNFIPIADNVMKEADFSKWDPPSLCVCPSMLSFRVPKLHGSQMRYVEVEERPYQVLGYHQVNAFFHSDEMRKAHYLFLSLSPSLSLSALCVHGNGKNNARAFIIPSNEQRVNETELRWTERIKRFSIALPFRTDTCVNLLQVHLTRALNSDSAPTRDTSLAYILSKNTEIRNEFKSLRLHNHRPSSSFPPFRVFYHIKYSAQSAESMASANEFARALIYHFELQQLLYFRFIEFHFWLYVVQSVVDEENSARDSRRS